MALSFTPLVVPLMTASVTVYMAVAINRVTDDRERERACTTAITALRSQMDDLEEQRNSGATAQQLLRNWPHGGSALQNVAASCGEELNRLPDIAASYQKDAQIFAAEEQQMQQGNQPSWIAADISAWTINIDKSISALPVENFVVLPWSS